MRAIVHKTGNTTERFISETDLSEHLDFASKTIRLNAEYAKAVAELAITWEEYKRDQQNLKLFFALSARIQALSQIALMAAQ